MMAEKEGGKNSFQLIVGIFFFNIVHAHLPLFFESPRPILEIS